MSNTLTPTKLKIFTRLVKEVDVSEITLLSEIYVDLLRLTDSEAVKLLVGMLQYDERNPK